MLLTLLLATATVAAPLPLTPEEETDIRCVAIVGVATRGVFSRTANNGREFAVMVGADIMDRTGRTREQVADLILAEGRRVAAHKPFESEVVACVDRINVRVDADAANGVLPPPQVPQ